jgi:dolichyl-phosphate-mannose-protein mannosyltransferase
MIHKLPSKSTIRSWLASPQAPLVTLCLLAIVGGVWIRSQALDYPGFMQLDEHHFVEAARAMLAGHPDPNDHPPLGKLLIAAVLSVSKDGPIAWRTSSLWFGFGSILLARTFAKRLFRDPRAGWLAGVFVAIDGFFIAYSRLALIDGVLVAMMLGAATLSLSDRRWSWITSGVVIGLAASVKFTGIVMLVPVALAIALRAGTFRRFATTMLAMCLAVVGAYWIVGTVAGTLGQVDQPWLYAWNDTRADVLNHLGTIGRAHPMTSRWYTWFLPETLVNFSFVLTRDGSIRMLSMLGNVLLWWSSPLCVGAGLVIGVRSAVRIARGKADDETSVRRPRRMAALYRLAVRVGRSMDALRSEPMRTWGLLFVFWITPLVPWMISDRDSYVYHYMPTYAFGLVAVAGWLSKAVARAPTWAIAVLGVIVAVSAFYAPLWGQLPVGYGGLDARLFLWR